MTVQVGPAQTRDIAFAVRTVVLQQQPGILENLGLLKFDTQVVVDFEEVAACELLV